MKRDWHLMGDIFNAIEDDRLELLISKYEANQNKYSILMQHLEMLIDADYIKGVTISLSVDGLYSWGTDVPRITLKGYDFADIVKDKFLLNKTIKAIKDAGYMVTWETLKEFAPMILKVAVKQIFKN